GLLRSPFATQGRSYTIKSDLPETIESPTKIAYLHNTETWPVMLWEVTQPFQAALPRAEN
ncbi:hypothetical protein, partial [Pseudomonas sp. SWRI51]|uniref:hypothetical protein n=1 Tax=Pseudomonas sp. SWRI51 TaxID=2745491 RepID=UPI001EE300B9